MKWLVRLYPKEWQERYRDEFSALLEQHHLSITDFVNICLVAGRTRIAERLTRRDRKSDTTSLRRSMSVAACLSVIVLGVFVIRGPTAQASPRYPVYFGVSNFLDHVTYSVTSLGATIPHVTLVVDSRGAWTLTRYETSAANAERPYRQTAVPVQRVGTHLFRWEFGRVTKGQSVEVTVSLTSKAVDPSLEATMQNPLRYSIFGYGNVLSNGDPDLSSPLTGIPYHFGPQTYTPLPLSPLSPTCSEALHFTLTAYQVCASGGIGADTITLNALNVGKRIPRFVLVVDSRKLWTEQGVAAQLWNGKSSKSVVPRLLSHHGSVYTWDFGVVPMSNLLRVRIHVIAPGGVEDFMWAYADLTRDGQPDTRAKLFSGGDTFH